jgi:hypothetical protein
MPPIGAPGEGLVTQSLRAYRSGGSGATCGNLACARVSVWQLIPGVGMTRGCPGWDGMLT